MRHRVWMVVAAMVAILAWPTAAQADDAQFGLAEAETGRIGTSDAGGHPTVWSRFRFKTDDSFLGAGRPHGIPQRVAIDMPYGLVGDPSVFPHCKMSDFTAGSCPAQSQVGVADPIPFAVLAPLPLTNRPIYVLEHDGGPGSALFGIDVLPTSKAYYRIYVRPDGGLRQMTDPLPTSTPLIENKLTLWGVPADENPCNPANGTPPLGCGPNAPGGWQRKPLMTSPTDCTVIPSSLVRAWSYEGRYDERRVNQTQTPENCDKVPFAPSLRVAPTNASSDGVSGLTVDLDVEQHEDPDRQGPAHVRHVSMTLPEGVSINPGAAVGLETCSDAAFGKGAEGAPSCPAAAKVGTARITSPLLDDPPELTGDVYMGAERPGERFRLFIYASGHNAEVKLAGVLRPDARTGQITAVFRDNPPLPFSNLHLEFRGGERGVLVMPVSCGTKTASATLTPYSGTPDATVTAGFDVADCPAPTPFAPTLGASVGSTQAGAHTPLTMTFVKPDKHAAMEGLEVDLPPGLLAKVRGVPRCADAQANAGTCPAASQVGWARTSSGPGGAPLTLDGKVFFTGPYKGAPYGLAVAVPAKAGPYDLGVVVVRQALHIDPTDAHVTVRSDPLPTILEGVLLRLQRIQVTVDRPSFTLNPTSCAPLSFRARLTAAGGTLAAPLAGFQATGCEKLPLKPKLAMALTGRKELTDGKHPGVDATLTQTAGESGLRKAAVSLPLSLALDPDNAQALCEFEAGKRVECPATSIVGTAVAESPVLEAPLSGPVYFVKNVRIGAGGRPIRTLPTLLVTLRGEVALNLRATTSVVKNRLVTTFEPLPDAPISRFQLKIDGGKHGILAAVANICAKKQVADAAFDGQNGKAFAAKPVIGLPCGMKVASRKWSTKAVTLKLTGLGAGRVVVSGKGVKRTARTLKSSPGVTVRVPLTKAGRRARSVKLRVAFMPKGAKKAKTMSTTVKRPKAKRKARSKRS